MRLPKRGRGHVGAFTLIELLVVVSIIALLLSILLPSLSQAREQAKRAVCSGRMHDVSIAMLAYAAEYNDHYPILLTVAPEPYIGVFAFAEWRYGGWAGKNPNYLQGSYGLYNLPARLRPLSRYILPGTNLPDDVAVPVFQCPSDRLSRHKGKDDEFSTYDDIGTSYTMNISWFWQPKPHWDREAWREGVERRGNEVWRKYAQRGAVRFVMLAEDPVVYALQPETGANRLVRVDGWHGQFSRHNLAFLDGHVAYMRIDTTKYRGPDWTAIDESRPPPT